MDAKKIFILSLIIIISLIAIFAQINTFRQGDSTYAEQAVSNVFKPVQTFFSDMGKSFSLTIESFTRVSKLDDENKRLQAEIYALKEEQELFCRATEENRYLKKLLDISAEQEGKVIAAEVIARDPDNWFQSIKINKGFKQGVSKGMIAVSSEGIVGKVISVSEQTSKIRLIFDEKSAIPAQIVSNGELGVVYGEGKNTCVMRYINADAKVNIDDPVITSKLSQIYPPGKIIGRVTKIYGRDQLLYQAIQIKPAVQFGNLEYVLLIGRKYEK